MTNEELFELLKSHFNNVYIKQVTFDFTNNDMYFTVVPPVALEYIKFDCKLVNKENG